MRGLTVQDAVELVVDVSERGEGVGEGGYEWGQKATAESQAGPEVSAAGVLAEGNAGLLLRGDFRSLLLLFLLAVRRGGREQEYLYIFYMKVQSGTSKKSLLFMRQSSSVRLV